MSGHSKWSTIKHKKAINDAKKGKAFSKVSAQLTHAARQGGGDPNMNPSLRLYVDKAKEVGFPLDKIEKAIQKGTGEGGDGVVFDESTYEGYGPHGVQFLVDTLSDNKNRTVAELRKLFEGVGGSMGEEGSVSWNFDIKGLVVIKVGHMEKAEKFGEDDIFVPDDMEEAMLSIMELDGVLDMEEIDMDGDKGLEIYTEYDSLASVRDEATKMGYVVKEASLIKEAKTFKEVSEKEIEKIENAIETIEDNDDVQSVWTNLNIS